jgi:uncharacterized Fe-S cluster-containing MiaB family protein
VQESNLMDENRHISKSKSFEFAVRVVKMARYLQIEKKKYVLSKQVLRSGMGQQAADSIIQDCKELISRLTSIVTTTAVGSQA